MKVSEFIEIFKDYPNYEILIHGQKISNISYIIDTINEDIELTVKDYGLDYYKY